MRSISWMTFIFVVAFSIYFRSLETFSSANRDQLSLVENKNLIIERSLSSTTDEKNIKQIQGLQDAIEYQPSIHDLQ